MSAVWSSLKNQVKAVARPKASNCPMLLYIYNLKRQFEKAKKLIIVKVYVSPRIEGNPPTNDVLKSIVQHVLQEQGGKVGYIPPYWVLVYVHIFLCLFFLAIVTNPPIIAL